MIFHDRFVPVIVLAVTLVGLAPADAPADPLSTTPAQGLRDNTPKVHALSGGRIVIAPGRVVEMGTLVIRDGVIARVGADVPVPADARLWDMTGKTIYPGLIDAYSEVAVEADSGGGAPYWNSQVRPQMALARHYKPDASLNEKLRGQGVTARLVAPQGGIIKGTSALVTTGDEQGSRAIVKDGIAMHMRLTVSRGGSGYPDSPMGAVALARQAMYDAKWYGKAWSAHRASRLLPRPDRNDALAALARYPGGAPLLIVDAANELYFLRADRFARELALGIVVRGSGNEYRRLEAIRASGRAVIVPLEFPKPPQVGSPEAALDVTLEELLHWDLAPENPARLHRAGVRIALTGHGLGNIAKLRSAVRGAIERGLPAEEALRALTVTPAELLGVSERLGTLQPGKSASFVVVDGELFDEKTKVHQTWVDGRRYEVGEKPLADLRGTWRVMLTDRDGASRTIVVKLSGSPAKLQGMVRREPQQGKPTKLEHIGFRDARFGGTFDGERLGRKGVVRIAAVVSGSGGSAPSWLGRVVWPDGNSAVLTAQRTAAHSPDEPGDEPTGEDGGEDGSDNENRLPEHAEPRPDRAASFEANFPLGAFGRSGPPEQPKAVLFRGATVWTCGERGVLENASVLVQDGKIVAVGSDLEAPEDALVVEAGGGHITPGIIDCHSHMATDGGVNESGQAVTAEVRIGDFIDPNDVNIYRQLAGGVTTANILHGSANPIGGQNQVIKLRWGALPDEMRFTAAPPGIKFALGENVKQSNWGDGYTTRYPQTRMGVEQIIHDEFAAARDYKRRWDRWRQTHEGLPPRVDLELEAIVEILDGKRLIHCHSYRQDEILALLRTLETFGVRVATLQHISEGYKVADAMVRHGATASTFSDWWAYKFEVYDAIPYNGALMHRAGIVVSFNSDSSELARHLNQEAAKAVKYGGVEPAEALKFITLNPAKQLHIDRHVGSIEPGKDADLVLWSGRPLSTLSHCRQTWIDGRKYFDRREDLALRDKLKTMRATLVQKILAAGTPDTKEQDDNTDEDQ